MPPDFCSHCGAAVPSTAKACPECGSDETTGWSEEAAAQGLDLPDDSFDYDEFVRRELGRAEVTPRRVSWLWWIAAVMALAGLLVLVSGHRF
jgi:hypothetical protein